MDISEARHHLTGPVGSFRTPFTASGDIDEGGARRIVDRMICGGTRTVMLTAGDSHYLCLSDDEVLRLTRLVVEHVAGRAMVIAADRHHATSRAVAFAEACRAAGADMFMAMPPDWAASCTPTTLAEHYAEVSRVMPVMIVTNLFLARGHAFGLEAVARALDAGEAVVAVKDDVGGVFAQDLCMRFTDRVAIIAGGQKRTHLMMHPYGCDGYLSTMIMYDPRVAQRYWAAITAGDLATAARIVADQDAPLFRHLVSLEGGFDAGMHGMMELYGLAGRHRRKPYHTLDDGAMDTLKQFLIAHRLLDA